MFFILCISIVFEFFASVAFQYKNAKENNLFLTFRPRENEDVATSFKYIVSFIVMYVMIFKDMILFLLIL